MKLVGYSDPWSVAPGETISLMVSCQNDSYTADVVRLRCGGETPDDPGFKQTRVPSSIDGEYPGRLQEIRVGSYALVPDAPPLRAGRQITLAAWVYPTTPTKGMQGLITKWSASDSSGYGLFIDENGEIAFQVGDGLGAVHTVSTGEPVSSDEWYFVAGSIDLDSGRMSVHQFPESWWRGGGHVVGSNDPVQIECIGGNASPLLMAASESLEGSSQPGIACHFNGKIDGPRVYDRCLSDQEIISMASGDNPSGVAASWDFSREISSDRIVDSSRNALHGRVVNLPARAVTGHNWTGLEADFRQAPDEYGAIYFHDDDLEDADWETDFEFEVPSDMKSGIYAARLQTQGGLDYVPFFVRAPQGEATARVLFLVPTLTYMAYGNEHFDELPRIYYAHINMDLCIEEYEYIRQNRLGSMYDFHPDKTGHGYFSRLRPVVNLRPTYYNRVCAGPFTFSADLHITDWLEEMGHEYDVATDEDLHFEGAELLAKYDVVLTGAHPEYYTSEMLDGLESYLENGGRLMYLGGNGFYWVTSLDPERPHIVEIRRRQGTRMTEMGPGEYHHSTTGEPGGLWRYRGRAPQRLVGIGFCAQGVDHGSPYRRQPGSFAPEAAFIFEGIGDDEIIGDSESLVLAKGAAGLELDRYDPKLGSPKNTIVLASSFGHSDYYQRTVEEVNVNSGQLGGGEDPEVRSDLVYFETPNGGAVFSVGSITWSGSLSYNNYQNNVSRITGNVLKRFAGGKTG
ncbi:MAG: N,N-dimethylformamidase [Chloroflexi bacterium]|nr:N,N-dimethylformamidase [Chloroflexota bacterium]MCY3936871.1 N,N-dimethylformamidase [Chloroflexota bacterium]